MLLNVPANSYTHVGTVIEFLDLLFDIEMNDIQALQCSTALVKAKAFMQARSDILFIIGDLRPSKWSM